ncbi:hypothetical protein PF005_g21084 [Phytophthora fragariae]|uniref:Uncharacterized protein n=1 Tax=Phytophthora fragariae TaxID=53985 RepID=A0A6A3HR07_9STRA|nr:hypothetical protein PF011_g26053 [Phytophthora fragariae]KAE9185854.1 hypothetical protein PF005_g21084 [Phytophthora fragariae]KAE9194650.1 hypothetical protein PF002_g23539 [Phytophthora fragariae]
MVGKSLKGDIECFSGFAEHAFNKLNDATIPAQTPIPRKDMVLDSMSGSVIYSAIDLTDGFIRS